MSREQSKLLSDAEQDLRKLQSDAESNRRAWTRERLESGALKREKLEHYATRDPKRFLQIDGFIRAEADCVMHPDRDGDVIFESETYELMASSAVRVLIDIDTCPSIGFNAQDVARVLRKMARIIEHMELNQSKKEKS